MSKVESNLYYLNEKMREFMIKNNLPEIEINACSIFKYEYLYSYLAGKIINEEEWGITYDEINYCCENKMKYILCWKYRAKLMHVCPFNNVNELEQLCKKLADRLIYHIGLEGPLNLLEHELKVFEA